LTLGVGADIGVGSLPLGCVLQRAAPVYNGATDGPLSAAQNCTRVSKLPCFLSPRIPQPARPHIAPPALPCPAEMGFRSITEMVGRADMLEVDEDVLAANPKLRDVDLSKILLPAAELRCARLLAGWLAGWLAG
jgi:hypothetical protein